MKLYDHLLQFPLFQGMSHDDLALVAGQTRFDFVKHAAGTPLAKEGDPCDRLVFLSGGSLRVEAFAHDHGYSLAERLSAPYILQPEALFGLHQRYARTFTAQTDVNLIILGKSEVMRLLEDFFIFRLNMLGVLSLLSQKQLRQPWRRPPQSLSERIARFFADRCLHPAGPKTVRILMERLAAELGDSRLDVSRALHQMQADGLLTLHRGRIEIPALERLL